MATIPDLTRDAGLPADVFAEKTILGAICWTMPPTPKPPRSSPRRLFSRLASPHLPAHGPVDETPSAPWTL